MKFQEIWIIGAGRMGKRAASALREENPRAEIAIVDSSGEACEQTDGRTFTVLCREGVDYLLENLKTRRGPDWIIPMIPVHVAYEWIRRKLKETHRVQPLPVPFEVTEKLPNPIQGADGQAYMSYADFICPVNCAEPDDICTHTGKPRTGILHRFLETVQVPEFRTVVVQSRQLAPGIGGYRPADLFHALGKIAAENGSVLLSTACRCHGVMHAFRIMAL